MPTTVSNEVDFRVDDDNEICIEPNRWETYLDEHDLLEMLAALGISLSMAGGDYEAALERMKLVYPISIDIGPDIK